ncbi:MAG: 3'-5' exonuclease [Micrococcaceae bacterium]|nr:3'-5' exonuclease [Micrococcaceae bacterium]
MTRPMTSAQQRQQNNRRAGGQYDHRRHSEADDISLQLEAGDGGVETFVHRDDIEIEAFQQLHDANTTNIQRLMASEKRFWDTYNDNKRRNGRGSYRAFPADDAMYQAHLDRKAAFYQLSLTDVAHARHAEAHGVDRSKMPLTSYSHYQREAEQFEQWKARQNADSGEEYVHRPNPSMNDDYHFYKAKRMLSVFTGRHTQEVERRANDLMQQRSMDRHEAMQELWSTANIRKDKPLVFIDFETACRTKEDIGTVDTGQYSDIIEVGYEKVHPDGHVESDTFLLDADQSLKALAGTGAQHVHNITPEMIEGKPKFSDPKVQRQMMEVMDNSVMVAHKVNFEHTQLSYSLNGYAGKWRDTLDTKDIMTYFVKTPESAGNRMQDMVQLTGGSYGDDAHRAMADVQMMRRAFDTVVQGDRAAYMSGDHEHYRAVEQDNSQTDQ